MVELTPEQQQYIEQRTEQINQELASAESSKSEIQRQIQQAPSGTNTNSLYNALDRKDAIIDALTKEKGLLPTGRFVSFNPILPSEQSQSQEQATQQILSKAPAGSFVNQGIVFDKDGNPIAVTSQQSLAVAKQQIAIQQQKEKLASGQGQSFPPQNQSPNPQLLFSKAPPQYSGISRASVDVVSALSQPSQVLLSSGLDLPPMIPFGSDSSEFQIVQQGIVNLYNTPLSSSGGFTRQGVKSKFGLDIPFLDMPKPERSVVEKGLDIIAPKTVGELATFIAFPLAISKAPKVLRIATGGYFGTAGTITAFNKSLLPEQRIAGAIVGGLGILGTAFETAPYIKGSLNYFSKDFKPVVTQPEGFSAIVGTEKPIGLILEKSPLKSGLTSDISLPKTSPLVRGGFGVKESEKFLFLGENQAVATSQISFFKAGKEIIIQQPKPEFFVSPQEPFLKIPETRLSRLGLSSDLFSMPVNPQLSFGIPGKSQIGLEFGASVTRSGKGFSYAIGKGTELEGIKGIGTTITDVKFIGVTTIKGQGVDIYTFKSGKSGAINFATLKSYSYNPRTQVSGFGAFSTLGFSLPKTSASTFTTSTKQIANFTSPISPKTSLKNFYSSPSFKNSFASLPQSPPTTFKSPPSSPPTTKGVSLFSPPRSPPTSPPRTPPTSPPIYPQSPPQSKRFDFKFPSLKSSFGNFAVFGRRFGQFKLVGIGKTEGQAFNIGKNFAKNTLGATFKVPTAKNQPRSIFGFKTKQTKQGTLFIQKPKYRLSTRSEVKEINMFRRMKGGSKKRR